MDELTQFFSLLFQSLRNEIWEFYNKCQLYIRELFVEKNIELTQVTTYESEMTINETLDKMIRTIRYTLSAVGFSRDELAADEKFLEEIAKKRGSDYPNYKSYYIKDLQHYFNGKLFQILIEYLVDLDNGKVDNLDIYNLISQNFILKLNLFKEENITTRELNFYIKEEIATLDNYVNPSNLEVIYLKKLKAERLEIIATAEKNEPEAIAEKIEPIAIVEKNEPKVTIIEKVRLKKISLEKITLSKIKEVREKTKSNNRF